uniref:Uncharacterized protein n=1 Tax=Spermophilus dauricus TaxID=99837 RepID=A0A8C9PMI3_SPEDA
MENACDVSGACDLSGRGCRLHPGGVGASLAWFSLFRAALTSCVFSCFQVLSFPNLKSSPSWSKELSSGWWGKESPRAAIQVRLYRECGTWSLEMHSVKGEWCFEVLETIPALRGLAACGSSCSQPYWGGIRHLSVPSQLQMPRGSQGPTLRAASLGRGPQVCPVTCFCTAATSLELSFR